MRDSFLGGLDEGVAKRLLELGATRLYPAGSHLFYEGDSSSSVIVLLSGLLRVDQTTPAGRVVLLNLQSVGDLLGELGVIDDQVRSATASAVTSCRVTQIPAQRFRAIMDAEPTIQRAVLGHVTQRLRNLTTQFLETSTMDAPARIAARLVRLADIERSLGRALEDAAGTIDLRLPINQEELGQWSGLSREGAVKGLAVLRSEGILETGRKRVLILDVKALRVRAAPI